MPSVQAKLVRLEKCNELIQVIGSHGRKIFSGSDYSRSVLPVAFLELDHRGRVYFHDEYTARPSAHQRQPNLSNLVQPGRWRSAGIRAGSNRYCEQQSS